MLLVKLNICARKIKSKCEVDDTGIEPVTPTMSMWCSTAEPIVPVYEVVLRQSIASLIALSPKLNAMEVGTGFEPV